MYTHTIIKSMAIVLGFLLSLVATQITHAQETCQLTESPADQAADCDDSDPCTTDSCTAGPEGSMADICIHEANGSCVCGDGDIDPNEECDGDDLGDAFCEDLGQLGLPECVDCVISFNTCEDPVQDIISCANFPSEEETHCCEVSSRFEAENQFDAIYSCCVDETLTSEDITNLDNTYEELSRQCKCALEPFNSICTGPETDPIDPDSEPEPALEPIVPNALDPLPEVGVCACLTEKDEMICCGIDEIVPLPVGESCPEGPWFISEVDEQQAYGTMRSGLRTYYQGKSSLAAAQEELCASARTLVADWHRKDGKRTPPTHAYQLSLDAMQGRVPLTSQRVDLNPSGLQVDEGEEEGGPKLSLNIPIVNQADRNNQSIADIDLDNNQVFLTTSAGVAQIKGGGCSLIKD
jgi:hypothetical protein